MSRCEAVTNSGKQCTRAKRDNHRHYCTQHSKVKDVTNIMDVDPWPDALVPSPGNGQAMIHKIRTKMNRGPTKNDNPGYIYVYAHQSDLDNKLLYFKIGRTERSVAKRLEEWGKECVLQKQFKVRYNKWVEDVVHKYLHYCRMYRYANTDSNKKGYTSVMAMDGSPVKDVHYDSTLKLGGKSKQVEWFKESKDTIYKIIRGIIAKEKMLDRLNEMFKPRLHIVPPNSSHEHTLKEIGVALMVAIIILIMYHYMYWWLGVPCAAFVVHQVISPTLFGQDGPDGKNKIK